GLVDANGILKFEANLAPIDSQEEVADNRQNHSPEPVGLFPEANCENGSSDLSSLHPSRDLRLFFDGAEFGTPPVSLRGESLFSISMRYEPEAPLCRKFKGLRS